MTVAQEEIFGPVLCVIAHDGDDAVRIANDSAYGLRGAVFSADHERALGVARRLRTGQVDINGYKLTIDIPSAATRSRATAAARAWSASRSSSI